MLLLVLLLPASAGAQSPAYDFSVSPDPPEQGEQATFTLTPTSARVERVRWDLDGDGDFDDGSTRVVRRIYANRGPVTVQMRAREEKGDQFQLVAKTIVVNGPPTGCLQLHAGLPDGRASGLVCVQRERRRGRRRRPDVAVRRRSDRDRGLADARVRRSRDLFGRAHDEG